MAMKSTRILRTADLSPDGVRIRVHWDDMGVDSSIFIPCVNTRLATEQVNKLFLAWGWEYCADVRVEKGKMGLRVWRTM